MSGPASARRGTFYSDARQRGRSVYVSSKEKTADSISQDPRRYSNLRQLAHDTHSEHARTYLELAGEFREQRWIELEKTRVGNACRPQGAEAGSRPQTQRSHRALSAPSTLRAVQKTLADEDDEAPLLPPTVTGGSESD